MAGPAGAHARHMLHYSAVGDGPAVAAYLSSFAERVHADEVMVTNQALGLDARLRAWRSSPPPVRDPGPAVPVSGLSPAVSPLPPVTKGGKSTV